MKWFKNINTIEDLRKAYRQLLKQYHPDCENGSVKITQEINAEYDLLFEHLKSSSQSSTNTSETNPNTENEAFKDILNIIIAFDMDIEIIGAWIWCFECYSYKNNLKNLGFNYAPKKKAWCWHYGEYKRFSKIETDINDIRLKYGSQKVSIKSKQPTFNCN